jgi:hypothetical protein
MEDNYIQVSANLVHFANSATKAADEQPMPTREAAILEELTPLGKSRPQICR